MDSESKAKTKKCPFCAEDVALQALKCKHCGEFFENPALPKSPLWLPPVRQEVSEPLNE